MVGGRLVALALGLVGCSAPGAEPVDCTPVLITSLAPGEPGAFVEPGSDLFVATEPPGADVSIWVDGGLAPAWLPLGGSGPSRAVPLRNPVEPGQTYTARIRRCGEVQDEASFTSLPPRQGAAALGKTWLVDLRDPGLSWTEPPVAPPTAFMDGLLGETSGVLFAPLRLDGETLDTGLSLAETSTGRLRQDPCVTPMILQGLDFAADPRLTVSLERLDLTAGEEVLPLEDFTLEAVFDSDGVILRNLRLSFSLDTRALTGAAESCTVLEALVDATCVPCEGQGTEEAPRCLLLDVSRDAISADDDLSFDEVPEPDVTCR